MLGQPPSTRSTAFRPDTHLRPSPPSEILPANRTAMKSGPKLQEICRVGWLRHTSGYQTRGTSIHRIVVRVINLSDAAPTVGVVTASVRQGAHPWEATYGACGFSRSQENVETPRPLPWGLCGNPACMSFRGARHSYWRTTTRRPASWSHTAGRPKALGLLPEAFAQAGRRARNLALR
jgi:hypothetical protein